MISNHEQHFPKMTKPGSCLVSHQITHTEQGAGEGFSRTVLGQASILQSRDRLWTRLGVKNCQGKLQLQECQLLASSSTLMSSTGLAIQVQSFGGGLAGGRVSLSVSD